MTQYDNGKNTLVFNFTLLCWSIINSCMSTVENISNLIHRQSRYLSIAIMKAPEQMFRLSLERSCSFIEDTKLFGMEPVSFRYQQTTKSSS